MIYLGIGQRDALGSKSESKRATSWVMSKKGISSLGRGISLKIGNTLASSIKTKSVVIRVVRVEALEADNILVQKLIAMDMEGISTYMGLSKNVEVWPINSSLGEVEPWCLFSEVLQRPTEEKRGRG